VTDQNPPSEDAQQTAGQALPADLDEQEIWHLPVEAEERRKMAETMQSLEYQHGDADKDAD
jgi:hypothetical protein